MIIQVIGIGLIATAICTLLRQHSPQFVTPVILVTVVILFALVVTQLSNIVDMLIEISSRAQLDNEQVQLVLKIIGIAYIAELGSSIAKDAGEASIASKIDLAGKVMILFFTTPVMYSILNLIIGMLP